MYFAQSLQKSRVVDFLRGTGPFRKIDIRSKNNSDKASKGNQKHAFKQTQINKTRAEQEKSKKENTRLQAEWEKLKTLEAESSSNGNEIKTLLTERETIRSRVTDILARLETLDL